MSVACLAGNSAALNAIQRAIETGFDDKSYLLRDADLQPLQKLDEYQKLVAGMK